MSNCILAWFFYDSPKCKQILGKVYESSVWKYTHVVMLWHSHTLPHNASTTLERYNDCVYRYGRTPIYQWRQRWRHAHEYCLICAYFFVVLLISRFEVFVWRAVCSIDTLFFSIFMIWFGWFFFHSSCEIGSLNWYYKWGFPSAIEQALFIVMGYIRYRVYGARSQRISQYLLIMSHLCDVSYQIPMKARVNGC